MSIVNRRDKAILIILGSSILIAFYIKNIQIVMVLLFSAMMYPIYFMMLPLVWHGIWSDPVYGTRQRIYLSVFIVLIFTVLFAIMAIVFLFPLWLK